MEPMSARGTWEHESFREYAEHSVEHDDVPEEVVIAARRMDIVSKPVKKSVDMSLPPEKRQRPRKNRMVITPPAQLAHARGSRAARWRRDGERKFAASQLIRGDAELLPREDHRD
jgi:hypothetical protein